MAERKILSCNRFKTGYGTDHYDVKFQGDWTDTALINCLDIGLTAPTDEEYEKYNKDCRMNYGGYVEVIHSDAKTDITRARVGVYYD